MLHNLCPLPTAEINTKHQYAERYHVHNETAQEMQSVRLREQGKSNPTVRKEIRINLLPHELESGNHSQKLFERMMGQNHQCQILIQHLMYHLTCPATEREKYISLEQESREAICLLQ